MSHLASTKPSLLRCWWWGDTCFHSLIEWWLPWMEPPVFSLCENMLMQIDANDVVLYMQISHATTLWLLFSRGQTNTCECMFVEAHVYHSMFGCMSGVFVWKRLLPQGYKCNQYAVSYKFESPCWLHCMTHFWERKTLLQGLRMQPRISDLFLLRNPNIVWLFLSLSSLFDSRQKRVHRKGKWAAVNSVLHCKSHKGRAKVAFTLIECSRYPKVNRECRNSLCFPGRIDGSYSLAAKWNVYLLYLLDSLLYIATILLIFHPCAALYPSQPSLCLKMEKHKSMCLIVESAVQIVILSKSNTTRTVFRDEIFLESDSFSSVRWFVGYSENGGTVLSGGRCKIRQQDKSSFKCVLLTSRVWHTRMTTIILSIVLICWLFSVHSFIIL